VEEGWVWGRQDGECYCVVYRASQGWTRLKAAGAVELMGIANSSKYGRELGGLQGMGHFLDFSNTHQVAGNSSNQTQELK